MRLLYLATIFTSAVVGQPINNVDNCGVSKVPQIGDKIVSDYVKICTEANGGGVCEYRVIEAGKCQQLYNPFYRNTATFVINTKDYNCSPRASNCGEICMSPTGCTFGSIDMNYEHKYNLTAIRWNNLISSFDCVRKRDS